jgi:chromosome segregation ATPase
MDLVKGIVKKYFRSYNRTLKDGTKKTYKTEQVQVTVSKSDNIFEDKEEVFIISSAQAEEFNDLDEMVSALELHNTMLVQDKKELAKKFAVADEDLQAASSELKAISEKLAIKEEELAKSNEKLRILKEDCAGLKEQLEENRNTISSLGKQLADKNFIISDLNDDLNLLNEKLNSQTDDIINDSEFISNEQFTSSSNSYSFDDYVELQKEYIALLKKYERSQEDLYNEKVKVIHYKNLLDKFKNFILRIQ